MDGAVGGCGCRVFAAKGPRGAAADTGRPGNARGVGPSAPRRSARSAAALTGAALTGVALAAALAGPVGAAAQPLVLEGDVPDGPERHFFVPFPVEAGTVEIEVAHDDLSAANILDWGLYDPAGHRGWGGGNTENAVVGLDRASRGYVPGPIPAGTWEVVVGKARLTELPGRYRIEVFRRTAPTLPAQPDRRPYTPPAPLERTARWYAGDFHAHSAESGDTNAALAALDAIAALAEARGLDFVVVTDHNVHSQLDFFGAVQARHPSVLLVPGVEYTTYGGHANGLGATAFVDHKLGVRGATLEGAVAAYRAQGALFSLNHPVLDIPNCIGCQWTLPIEPTLVDAVEIQNTSVPVVQILYLERALAFWDGLLAAGSRAAAVGGSDDHRAGMALGPTDSPVGDPTTMVFAPELSVSALLDAVKAGRTAVKLQGPEGPMVELDTTPERAGDTVRARAATVRLRVSGGAGGTLEVVKNGAVLETVAVPTDPFTHELAVQAPARGEDRYRADLTVDGTKRVVTSHVWVRAPDDDGGGCSAAPSPSASAAPALLLALLAHRRRRARALTGA